MGLTIGDLYSLNHVVKIEVVEHDDLGLSV